MTNLLELAAKGWSVCVTLIAKLWELAPYVVGLHGVFVRDAMQTAFAALWLALRAQPKDVSK